MQASQLTWRQEHDTVTATYEDYQLRVKDSGGDGKEWSYMINDGEWVSGFDTKEEAQQAAVEDAIATMLWNYPGDPPCDS
jgi:hypothetical protein